MTSPVLSRVLVASDESTVAIPADSREKYQPVGHSVHMS
jgi:hypothetical protein